MLIEKPCPKIKSSYNHPSLNMPTKPVPEKNHALTSAPGPSSAPTLSNDPLADKRFDFPFVNPPCGYEWSKDSDVRWQFGVTSSCKDLIHSLN